MKPTTKHLPLWRRIQHRIAHRLHWNACRMTDAGSAFGYVCTTCGEFTPIPRDPWRVPEADAPLGDEPETEDEKIAVAAARERVRAGLGKLAGDLERMIEAEDDEVDANYRSRIETGDLPHVAYEDADALGVTDQIALLTADRDRWKALALGERERIATEITRQKRELTTGPYVATGPAARGVVHNCAAHIRGMPAPTPEDRS